MVKIIDRLLGFISLIGASMLTVPLSIILLGTSFEGSAVVIPILSVVFSFLGYIMQSLNAKLQNKRASEDGFSSLKDGALEGFKPIYAAVPIAILIMLSIPLSFAFDKLMQTLYLNGFAARYDLIYTVF